MSESKYPKYKVVKLPSLSPTMETGTITSWDKAVGDKLEDGEIIAQIETDKAVMAMETPYVGYLAKILVPEGTKDIEISKPIAIIVPKSEQIDAFADFTIAEIEGGSPQKPAASAQPSTTTTTNNTSGSLFTPTTQKSSSGDRLFASPYAKKVAFENQVDIRDVSSSGGTRITSKDVISHVSSSTSHQVQLTHSDSFTDIELTNMRKTIASRLTHSKSTIPHFYLTSTIRMDNVIELRKKFNQNLVEKNIKLSINDFILKAASKCLVLVPECNSSFMDTFIRQFNNIDINVAVSTDTGLITPFIKNTDRQGLVDISKQVKELANKARNRTLQPDEFQGGTFTVSNLGMYGITNFTAIINPPQSCILAVGANYQEYVADAQMRPQLANFMQVTLCCDHRVVDGAVGATWLRHFKSFMEDPINLLL